MLCPVPRCAKHGLTYRPTTHRSAPHSLLTKRFGAAGMCRHIVKVENKQEKTLQDCWRCRNRWDCCEERACDELDTAYFVFLSPATTKQRSTRDYGMVNADNDTLLQGYLLTKMAA